MSIFATTVTTDSGVVYFFQAALLFCQEDEKFCPILAPFGQFVVNLPICQDENFFQYSSKYIFFLGGLRLIVHNHFSTF